MLSDELKAKDDDYVKAIKHMDSDINSLIEKMQKQHIILREGFERELKNVEDEYLHEREQLLKKNKEEIDNLFKEHEDSEKNLSEKKMLQPKH